MSDSLDYWDRPKGEMCTDPGCPSTGPHLMTERHKYILENLAHLRENRHPGVNGNVEMGERTGHRGARRPMLNKAMDQAIRKYERDHNRAPIQPVAVAIWGAVVLVVVLQVVAIWLMLR